MAKFYQDGDGFLLETSEGNFEVRNSGFFNTTRTSEGLTEAYPDITVQAVASNAKDSVVESKMVSPETASALLALTNHLVENAA